MKQKAIKRVWLLIGILCVAYTASAQTILLDPPESYLGITVGGNAGMLNFDPLVEQTPHIGYMGGLVFRYVTEKQVGLQVETNIIERGWEEKNGQYGRKITYAELPFLSHFYIGKKHRLIFNLGTKIGLKIDEKETRNSLKKTTHEQHIKTVHQPFDYGIVAGLGYNFKTKKIGLFQFETRAYYGLSDVFSNQKTDFFNTSNHINLSLQLSWMIQLSGNKK